MAPLHTLMFGWEYPPLHSGGLGVACQGLVRGLLQHNMRITLILPVDAEEESVDVRSLGGTLSILPVRSDLQPYDNHASYALRTRSLPATQTSSLYGSNFGEAVHQFTEQSIALTRDIRPDIVHSHDWMTFEAGRRAAAHHGVSHVTHIHATELDRTNFQPHPWIEARERAGLLSADKVIAVSQYTKDLLTRHYGIPAGKIAVVHNGYDAQALAWHSAPIARHGRATGPLVLFLGRLTVQKNPWQFLQVARQIHAVRPDAQFVMAGEGPLLSELVEQACALGLADCMAFAGKVHGNELSTLYKQADCFVMPSVSEPFGLVALEAIAHGVPVVLSRQSGAGEVIDHAFKVDFWDTDKMADCILTILRERPLALQLSSEAPRILQKLTWKNQAQKVTSIYQNLINA